MCLRKEWISSPLKALVNCLRLETSAHPLLYPCMHKEKIRLSFFESSVSSSGIREKAPALSVFDKLFYSDACLFFSRRLAATVSPKASAAAISMQIRKKMPFPSLAISGAMTEGT